MTDKDPMEAIRRRIAADPKLAEEVAEEKKRMTRRNFMLFGAGTAAVAAAGATFGGGITRYVRGHFRFAEAASAETPPRTPSEHFERAVSSYQQVYGELGAEQVLFIDHFAAPIGEPRTAVLIDDPEHPGKKRIDQEWLDTERQKICDAWQPVCDPKHELPRQLNVIGHLQGRPEGTTFADILADAEHGGAQYEGMSRIKYAAEHIGMFLAVDNGRIAGEICRLVPALIGQESCYRDDVTSEDGALSSAQAMPETLADLGYTAEDMKDFKKQLQFIGAACEQNYDAITRVAREELRDIKKEFFPAGQGAATFDEDFLAQVVVNAYNAGSGTMVAVLRWFREKYPTRDSYVRAHGPQPVAFGRDLFLRMTQEAYFEGAVERYGRDSSLYCIGIEGLTAEMKKRNLY